MQRTDAGDDRLRNQFVSSAAPRLNKRCADVDGYPRHVMPLGRDSKRSKSIRE